MYDFTIENFFYKYSADLLFCQSCLCNLYYYIPQINWINGLKNAGVGGILKS